MEFDPLLEGWSKPVVLTGSQIPRAEVRSDARENLVTSLLLAADDDLAEGCVYLNGVLLRGNRATKVSDPRLRRLRVPQRGAATHGRHRHRAEEGTLSDTPPA